MRIYKNSKIVFKRKELKMKKIACVLCALTLSAMIFAGCSDKVQPDTNDNNVNETAVSKTETTAAEDSVVPDSEKTMTQKYSELIKARNFSIKVDQTSDFMGKASVEIKCNDKDYCLSMFDEDEGQSDIYIVGGVLYTLQHFNKTYLKNDQPDPYYLNNDMSLYTLSLDDSFVYDSTEEKSDGMICETYYVFSPDPDTGEVSTDKDDPNTTCYKYYYKKDSDHPEKIEVTIQDMTLENNILDFKTGVGAVELPDLTDWEDQSEGSGEGKESDEKEEPADSPAEADTEGVEVTETDPADTEE